MLAEDSEDRARDGAPRMLAEDSEDRARGGAPPTGVGSADGATEPICAICHDELSRRTRMVVSMPVVEANGRQTCGGTSSTGRACRRGRAAAGAGRGFAVGGVDTRVSARRMRPALQCVHPRAHATRAHGSARCSSLLHADTLTRCTLARAPAHARARPAARVPSAVLNSSRSMTPRLRPLLPGADAPRTKRVGGAACRAAASHTLHRPARVSRNPGR